MVNKKIAFKKSWMGVIMYKVYRKLFPSSQMENSFDSIEGTIRLDIHLIEKALVKGDLEQAAGMNRIERVLDNAGLVLQMYSQYPKGESLIAEAIGIVQTVIYLCENKDDIQRKLDKFIQDNSLENIVPKIIKINKICRGG